MSVRAERIKTVIDKRLLPEEKIVKLLNDYLLWEMITVEEYDTLTGLLNS